MCEKRQILHLSTVFIAAFGYHIRIEHIGQLRETVLLCEDVVKGLFEDIYERITGNDLGRKSLLRLCIHLIGISSKLTARGHDVYIKQGEYLFAVIVIINHICLCRFTDRFLVRDGQV